MHVLCALHHPYALNMAQGVLLCILKVCDQRPSGGYGTGHIVTAEAGQGRYPKVVKEPLLCAGILVCPVAVALGVVLRLKLAGEQLVEEYCVVCHYFGRLYAAQLVHKLGCILFPAVFVYVKCACGNVAVSEAEIAVAKEDGYDIVILTLGQHAFLNDRSGSHHSYDFPLYKALGFLGISHLLADSYFITLFNKLAGIYLYRMVGHAAHGRAFLKAAVATSENYFKLTGSQKSVLKKHLVKVAKTVKEYTVLVFLLYLHILAHHWGKLCGHICFAPEKFSLNLNGISVRSRNSRSSFQSSRNCCFPRCSCLYRRRWSC